MKKMGYIVSVLLLSLFVFVQPAAADAGEQPDPYQLEAVLIWFVTGAGSVWAINKVVSLLLEDFSWWHNLHRKLKFTIMIAAAVLVSVAAMYLLQAPEVLAVITPYYKIVAGVVLSALGWITSQNNYGENRKEPIDSAF